MKKFTFAFILFPSRNCKARIFSILNTQFQKYLEQYKKIKWFKQVITVHYSYQINWGEL